MNDNKSIGTAGLSAAIAGILLPVIGAFLVVRFVRGNEERYYFACIALFFGLELIALVCGICRKRER